jgi:hydrophobe/amphiphile efflux-1 (HAE1) family protein
MAQFFIDRPVFAIVVALVITLAGVIAGVNLPVAQYPDITLPTINVSTNYMGASADVVEQAIAQPVEEAVNGVDGMFHMDSQSANNGTYSLNVTFDLGRDPDISTVLVQNRVARAAPTLPSEVNQQGIVVQKQQPDVLMHLVLYSPKGTYDDLWLGNYGNINVVDPIKRVKGVGDVRNFGSDFGMRLWLRPDKMARLGITAGDVARAVKEQNVQAPAGQVGQYPSPEDQAFQYSVRVQGRLTDPQEFEDIVVHSEPDGSFVRIKDIARVELAARDYSALATRNGKPAAVFSVNLTPDASAVETASLIRAELKDLARRFPADVAYEVFTDSTVFVKESLSEVVKTFFEALALVLLVVFLFLQSWRATLIPVLAVPVSLVGTFAAFLLLGFSINTLTLFGMVLAIGIVVDDAIVVVEAVQHHMEAEGVDPREATRRAMKDVSGPVVAIALVLSSVFVPVAFLGGIAGQLYKQFAVTVTVSVLLSALVALSLTPALCALLLKRPEERRLPGPLARFTGGFERWFERTLEGYTRGVRLAIRRTALVLTTLLALTAAAGLLMKFVPKGFVPDEDQGYFFGSVTLPQASSLVRTKAAVEKVDALARQVPGVDGTITVVGYDILSGTIQSNTALVVGHLKPWSERKSKAERIDAVLAEIRRRTSAVPDAVAMFFNPPSIPGMGNTGGFQMMLEDRAAGLPEDLAQVAQQVVTAARARPEIGQVYTLFDVGTPALQLAVDREKCKKLGVPVDDVFIAFQSFLGGLEINDFSRFGRNFKVTMQAEPRYRSDIRDAHFFHVRGGSGAMVPLDTLVTARPTSGPQTIERYNVYRTAQVGGTVAPGYSSGQAIAAMEEVAERVLPGSYAYEWYGLSLQEKLSAGKAPLIFGLALLFVFLFLAAQYESWAVPLAVLMAVPIGVFGALAGQWARGLQNNVYAQIGLILLIGLAAKNAILIVEFAKVRRESGMDLVQAATEAARLRLRPILMTSLAFILGVVPLVLASGAGSGARHALGTSVFFGMIAATGLAIFVVPVLFVEVVKIAERLRGTKTKPPSVGPQAGGGL